MIQLDGSNLTMESRQVGTRCGAISPSPATTGSWHPATGGQASPVNREREVELPSPIQWEKGRG